VADEEITAELDQLAGADRLAALPDVPTAEIEALAGRLTDLERAVSSARRGMFSRIDALQAELVRRYRTGEATVEPVLDPAAPS
jgi:hypothetical protein